MANRQMLRKANIDLVDMIEGNMEKWRVPRISVNQAWRSWHSVPSDLWALM